MLTVLTWLWSQPRSRTTYTAEHVNIWAAMVRRNLTIPHRLACVTATPEGIDPSVEIIAPPGEFEGIRIPSWGPRMPQCLRRLVMFKPDAEEIFGERFVCMDLDIVIGANIDALFDHDEEFMIYRGTNRSRPYNGSMFMLRAGARSRVYTEFSPDGAVKAGRAFTGSDQAWLAYVLGWCEKTWGPEHGVHFYGNRATFRGNPMRMVMFPGHPKPWQINRKMPPLGGFIADNYRLDEARAAA